MTDRRYARRMARRGGKARITWKEDGKKRAQSNPWDFESCCGRSNDCAGCGGEEEINFEAVYRQTEEKRGCEIDLPKYNKLVKRDPRFDDGRPVSEREWIMACCHLGIKTSIGLQKVDFKNVHELGGLRVLAAAYMDAKFEELDSNGKGHASMKEFKAFMCKYGRDGRTSGAEIESLWKTLGLTAADEMDREAFDDAFLHLTGPKNWI